MAEFINDDVTITQQFNVKGEVSEGLPVDEDLGHMARQGAGDEGHGPHLQRRPDDDEQVALVLVHGHVVVELVGEALAEEHDVWLHDGQGRRRGSYVVRVWNIEKKYWKKYWYIEKKKNMMPGFMMGEGGREGAMGSEILK